MSNNGVKRKGIFFSWLLSYILILLIPLIINVFAYTQSLDIIEYEISKAHAASLKQVQQIIDSRLADIERLSMQIALNDKIKGISGYKQTFSRHFIYNMISIINNIKSHQIANNFIDDLYVYFKHYDFVLSQNGKCTSEEFYNFYCLDYEQDYENWLNMLNGIYGKRYIAFGHTKELSNRIVFLRSLPVEYPDLNEGAIVITMDEDQLIRSMKNIKWIYQGYVVVVDQNNNILLSTKKFKNKDVIDYSKLNNREGIISQNLNGQEVVISYVTSDVTGWRYVSVMPTSIFLEKAKYIKRVIFACTCLCLIIGVWTAYILSRKNYNPVQRVINLLAGKTEFTSESIDDEFYYIEQSILHVLHEKDELNEELDKQKDILRNNFLTRLIKGNLKNYTSIQDACRTYNIQFKYDYFLVMVLYYEDESITEFHHELEDDMERVIDAMQFITKNVVNELINQYSRGYIIDVDNNLVCIANFEDENNARQITENIIDKSRRFLKEKFGISILVSISSIHTGYQGIPTAFEEAVQAFEFSIIAGSNQVMFYDDIDFSNKVSHGSSFSEQQKFINAIQAGNYMEAEKIFNDIIEKDFACAIPSIQMLRCKMFGLINTMILAMEEASVDYEGKFWEELSPVEKLLSCNTIGELKRQMHSILKRMDCYVRENREKKNNRITNQIISFINENYADVNLSVSMIAERFQMNSSYLSRFFKKQTGTGLLDYIHKVRIDNAKKLIKDTGMNLKEISDKVGYYNSVAFIRAFKRYEGMTPGQYRDIR